MTVCFGPSGVLCWGCWRILVQSRMGIEAMRESDKNLHKSLRKLLKEMIRSDELGKDTGEPEPLKNNLSRLWSRRILRRSVWFINSTTLTFASSLLAGTIISLNSRNQGCKAEHPVDTYCYESL